MDAKHALEKKREELLQGMAAIRSMEPAALSEQMLQVRHKGKKKPVLRGPYYVFSHWENGKNCSRRVKKGEVAQAKADVANYRHFVALCEQFVEVTRQLGQLEREAPVEQERLKKNPNRGRAKRRSSAYHCLGRAGVRGGFGGFGGCVAPGGACGGRTGA